MAADALSQKSGGSLAALLTQQLRLLKYLKEMQLDVRVTDSSNITSQLNQVSVKFYLHDKINEAQQVDSI